MTFFGHSITVSGLVTGIDLISQLKNMESDGIIIPMSMMKSGEEVFLDNLTLEQVSEKLKTKIMVSNVNGKDFMDIFI